MMPGKVCRLVDRYSFQLRNTSKARGFINAKTKYQMED